MICEVCKNHTATIHMTEIVNGSRNERHLCQDCASAEGLAVQTKMSLNELLSSLLAAGNEVGSISKPKNVSCNACGMTPEQFQDQTLLGCEKDYEVFGSGLEEIIKRAQNGNTQHVGKTPENIDMNIDNAQPQPQQEHVSKPNEAELLQTQLDEAVNMENYELAAKLRDKIKEIQNDETD